VQFPHKRPVYMSGPCRSLPMRDSPRFCAIQRAGRRLCEPSSFGFLIAERKCAGYSASEPPAPRKGGGPLLGIHRPSRVAHPRLAAVWVLSAWSGGNTVLLTESTRIAAPLCCASTGNHYRHDGEAHECQPVNSLKGAPEHLHIGPRNRTMSTFFFF
jgi:hypothetical protein